MVILAFLKQFDYNHLRRLKNIEKQKTDQMMICKPICDVGTSQTNCDQIEEFRFCFLINCVTEKRTYINKLKFTIL